MHVLAIAAAESDHRPGRAAAPDQGGVLGALAGAEGDIDGGLRRILLGMASIGFAIPDRPEASRPMVAAVAAADAPPTFSHVAIIGSMSMRNRDTPDHIARDARHPGARR